MNGAPGSSFHRTTSSSTFMAGGTSSAQYNDSLESLDQRTWQSLATHARGYDLQSPEVQEQIDVTDARLKSIFDAFDQDWDGTLTRSELLQGLAQQGFPDLDGTEAFEALWDACDKSGGKAGKATDSTHKEQQQHDRPQQPMQKPPLPPGLPQHQRSAYLITFDAFKRIVQRLKIEVLFLPELHPGCMGLFQGIDTGSRAGTPGPFMMGSPPPPPASTTIVMPTARPGVHTPSINHPYQSSAPTQYSNLGSATSVVPTRYGSNLMTGPVTTTCSGVNTSSSSLVGAVGEACFGGGGWGHQARFSYVDYNEKKYRAEIPVADPYSFFTAHRDSSDFIMRWLHLEGADRLNILRLGVKYSVHPLAVEDSLKLEEQQPKVNAYGSHYFIVVPFFRLSQESRLGMEALRQQRRNSTNATPTGGRGGSDGERSGQHQRLLNRRDSTRGGGGGSGGGGRRASDGSEKQEPLDVQVEWSKLCLFVAGPPLFDTVISIHTKWENFNSGPGGGRGGDEGGGVGGGGGSFEAHQNGDGAAGGGLAGGCQQQDHRHVFDAIVSQLKVDYSVLRQGNSKQLLYRILDEVVDNIQPITRAYRMRVRYFQDQLQQPDFNFSKEEMKELINIKSELQRLQRRLKPLTSVIRHLMDDPNVGKDIKIYLDDVCEHVIRGLEEVGGCIEMVDSTKEESRALREQRANEVLYTLTLVTTIFVPMQFVTGIYGMNFVDSNGNPSMPELLWPHGYLYFWLLTGALFLVFISYFKFIKRWL